MNLYSFRTLGRSGLVVSPLALGTMTFGQSTWGATDDNSRAIFDAYVDAGGNFIDTANVYSGGVSEELVGRFVAERGLRDQLVIATKFGFNADTGIPIAGAAQKLRNPHAGGNGAKHIHRALENSLRRLKTDYVDLYWLHVWDTVTPVEEVLQTLGDLQRAGRIRYFGFSDLPAWYAVKAATLATAHALPGPIAMQLEYSLAERSIEREHFPAAHECGLGITPWGPLAAGFLTGKYRRDAQRAGDGRLNGPNPYGDSKFTEANWRLLDVLEQVAAEIGRPPAQAALAWVVRQPGVSATIIGASKPEQLLGNLAALEVEFSDAQRQRLDQASALAPAFPYAIFTPQINRMLFGGHSVEGWR